MAVSSGPRAASGSPLQGQGRQENLPLDLGWDQRYPGPPCHSHNGGG